MKRNFKWVMPSRLLLCTLEFKAKLTFPNRKKLLDLKMLQVVIFVCFMN